MATFRPPSPTLRSYIQRLAGGVMFFAGFLVFLLLGFELNDA